MLKRQLNLQEAMHLLQKIQDPNFRRLAYRGLQFICMAGLFLLTLLTLFITVPINHLTFTAANLGGMIIISSIAGLLGGYILARILVNWFQRKILSRIEGFITFKDLYTQQVNSRK